MRDCLPASLIAVAINSTLLAAMALATEPADKLAGLLPPETILTLSDHGRLFPARADVSGDGKLDLTIGMTARSGGGRLQVYPNQGTGAHPRYDEFVWLHESEPTARVPDG